MPDGESGSAARSGEEPNAEQDSGEPVEHRRRLLVQHLADALRLYVLTDTGLAAGRDEADIVRRAIGGGATAIQLRWKTGPMRRALELGRQLRELCHASGVPFIVNDRVDLALALDADGVHVGVDDLPVAETRKLVGDRMLVGYSPPTLDDALRAAREGADYLGVGPVYPTTTKLDAGTAVNVAQVKSIAEVVGLPVVGIGGITAGNAAPVIEAGAAGVAVISAVVAAKDVRAAAVELRRVIDAALEERQ
ncbi:MAG TPA: thiamine phosphate synthase [Thermomicrobiaceae bacterium]|nr:thiamine phosphate synthase [Thermomicrobiaceae bacterium]